MSAAVSHPACKIVVAFSVAEHDALSELATHLRMDVVGLVHRTVTTLVNVSQAVRPAAERLQS